MLELALLLMLISANGAPVILHRYCGRWFSWPIDNGYVWIDGHPLFGFSKTWRGLFSGTLCAAVASLLMGFSFLFGLIFGFSSLIGDLFSSFVKRRMNLPPSSKALGVDQIPEAILPLIIGTYYFEYGVKTVLVVTLSFFLLNVVGSPFLYKVGIRKRPH